MWNNFLSRLFKNKMKFFVFLLIITIPLYDLSLNIRMKLDLGEAHAPFYSGFLTASTEGHLPQIYLQWYLPIFLLLLVSSNYIDEKNTNFHNIIIGKLGKKNYILSKFKESFFISSGTILLALTINLIGCILFLHGETLDRGFLAEKWPENILFTLSQQAPYLSYIIFMFMFAFIAGLYSIVATCICMLFPDKKIAYPIAFLVWFIQVLINGGSVVDLFQPYTENDFSELLPILIRVITIAIIIIVGTFVYKVKQDEI